MKRSVLILGLIGAVLLGVVWWLFLASPQRDDVTEFRNQRETLEIEESTLRTERSQLLEIRDNELTYLAVGATLERLIPETPELATFIDDMNLLAEDAGVVLLAISPGLPTPDPTGTFQEVAVSLDVEGQFFEVLGFLFGVSDMERLVRVDSVSFNPGEDEFGTISISVAMEAVIFTTAPPPPDLTITPPDAGTPDDGGDTGEGGDTGDTGGEDGEV